jgi:hypothetical protein
VSSRPGLILVDRLLGDVEPGAGQDAYRVGVVVAAVAGALVEVGGAGVGVAAVAGEVADRVAQSLVEGPAEGHDADLAGFAGRWGYAGQAGQGVGGGEAAAGVTDLGQQPSGAYGAGPGQRRAGVVVRVQFEGFGDLLRERLDLGDDRVQGGQVRAGDAGQGLAALAGRAARRGGDPAAG